jgi:hypothetical protein
MKRVATCTHARCNSAVVASKSYCHLVEQCCYNIWLRQTQHAGNFSALNSRPNQRLNSKRLCPAQPIAKCNISRTRSGSARA